jgi:hypothetical protein
LPDRGATVLECTNMRLFASRILSVSGLPVIDTGILIRWTRQPAAPQR